MNESIFKRDSKVPFLAYGSFTDEDKVSLHALNMDEHAKFNLNDVFKTCEITYFTEPIAHRLLILSNKLANRVAVNTRRGAGNHLFINPETNKERLADIAKLNFEPYELTVIEDESVPTDELRVMYFRSTHNIVDGPFQIVDNKLYCHPAYNSFFARGKF